jgi:hypothetical protein
LPAQLALSQFNFRQIVRVARNPDGSLPKDWPEDVGAIPAGAQYAFVDEYQASWYALGHSLGEIQYSLPLAPGESVKLAVIDWSWNNLVSRDEKTRFTEEILHQTHRDRSISETVKAAVDEWQRGGNFQAGIAGGSGSAGSAGGKGFSSGTAWSLGGGYSTSSGSRRLAADNVQKLSDSFVQASSAQRELNSTVVIQARQEEREGIQTRTFTNYNHSHTLTILYYEVLRHFKLEVEWMRRRPAVLVAKPTSRLPIAIADRLIDLRYLLEPHLLDSTLAGGFDATARCRIGEVKFRREVTKWSASAQTIDPGNKVFVKLIASFTTSGDDTTDEPIFVSLHLLGGRVLTVQFDGAGKGGTSPLFEKALPAPVFWREITSIEVKLLDINSGSDWTETNIVVNMATETGERVTILADSNTRTLDDDGGSTGLMPTVRPPAPTTVNSGKAPVIEDFVSVEDEEARRRLLEQLIRTSFTTTEYCVLRQTQTKLPLSLKQKSGMQQALMLIILHQHRSKRLAISRPIQYCQRLKLNLSPIILLKEKQRDSQHYLHAASSPKENLDIAISLKKSTTPATGNGKSTPFQSKRLTLRQYRRSRHSHRQQTSLQVLSPLHW